MPQVIQASQVIAQRWVASFQPELQAAVKSAVEQQMGKAGG